MSPSASRRGAAPAQPPEAKACAVCGRAITWRKKWERDWDQVKHCSQACRRRGLTPADRALEQAILTGLRARPAAPAAPLADVAGRQDEPARSAARRLAAHGRVQILQRGRVTDPSTAKGPIQVRLVRGA